MGWGRMAPPPICAKGVDKAYNPFVERIAVSGNSSVVEHRLAKAGVAGSNPVSRSILFRLGFNVPFTLILGLK